MIANPGARSLRACDGMLLEAVITAGLVHRNLAATHGHVWVSRRMGGRRGEDSFSDDGPQSGLLLELTSPGRWRADVMTWAASPDAGQSEGSGEGLGSGPGAGREHSPIALERRARLAADFAEACNEMRLPEAAGCPLGKPRQVGRMGSSSEARGGGAQGRSEEVWLIMDYFDRGCLLVRPGVPGCPTVIYVIRTFADPSGLGLVMT